DDLGPGLGDDPLEQLAVLDRADEAADLVARALAPGVDALLERADRRQRVAADALDPAPADEVVDDGDLVAAGGEPEGRRPAQITVAPEDENAHRSRQRNGSGTRARA